VALRRNRGRLAGLIPRSLMGSARRLLMGSAVPGRSATGLRKRSTPRLLGLLTLGMTLGGCAAYVEVMREPRTGEVQTCRAIGWGAAGVRRATVERAVCLATLRSLGFRPVPSPGRSGAFEAP